MALTQEINSPNHNYHHHTQLNKPNKFSETIMVSRCSRRPWPRGSRQSRPVPAFDDAATSLDFAIRAPGVLLRVVHAHEDSGHRECRHPHGW